MDRVDNLLATLANNTLRDDVKLKAVQDISDGFESIVSSSPNYPIVVENLLRTFTKTLLVDTTPQFIGENNTQQLRKLMLEMLQRTPLAGDQMKHSKTILAAMYKMLEVENEENSLICIRIITDFHKQYRPAFSQELQQFLSFVKRVFRNLSNHTSSVFEPRTPHRVSEIQEFDIETALGTTYVTTPIQTEQTLPDGTLVTYTLLPRGILSLRVLADLPLTIILFHQIYKVSVQQDVQDFVPLIINTLTMFPSAAQKDDPNFSREILMDFLNIQVKAVSFFAVLCRTMPDAVTTFAGALAKALPAILAVCPPDVSSVRRDLIVAFRHLLTTELRNHFVLYLNQLFDDNLMLGSSFTAHDNLRAMTYSTLADLVHHSRNHLTFQNQSASIANFSRIVFDSTLPCGTQTIGLKLLLNLVESMTKQTETNSAMRDIAVYLLDIFVRKFKEVATEILPAMLEKCENVKNDTKDVTILSRSTTDLVEAAIASTSTSNVVTTTNNNTAEVVPIDNESKEADSDMKLLSTTLEKDGKLSYGTPTPNFTPTLSDVRNLVKVLTYAAKTISLYLSGCKCTSQGLDPNYQPVMMGATECQYFVKVVEYGLVALDIYMIVPGPTPNTFTKAPGNSHSVRSKEEKEVMEHFAGIFNLMNLQTFKEIFTTTIDLLVDRIGSNHVIQLVPNSFLVVSLNTSAAFGVILLQYLVKRMHQMGGNQELSNLYLRLLKLIYNSVTAFPAENEQMLRPYLHKLVNNCIEMAIVSKEPFNYLLLLRGLFRSIGGGSHDVLYQEFLPVLPGLLKSLNSLQNVHHPLALRELIVELCLTVPVRLSSLVPHIPMLMEPLVLALNGTPSLVLQGLRTLELCIDNLQPDFLHEHVGSVRSNLMHALWKIIRQSSNEQAAVAAWRTVGKLGGLSRKVLIEKQNVPREETLCSGPVISIKCGDLDKINIRIDCVLQNAIEILKQEIGVEPRLKVHAIKLLTAIVGTWFRPSLIDNLPDPETLQSWFTTSDENQSMKSSIDFTIYQFTADLAQRDLCVEILVALISASNMKDIDTNIIKIVRHLAFLVVYEEIGFEKHSETFYEVKTRMDVYVLSDALLKYLSSGEKEAYTIGINLLNLMLETVENIFPVENMVYTLHFIQQLTCGILNLCYASPWYAKLSCCYGINFLFEKFPHEWIVKNARQIFVSLLFIIQELCNEITNGTIDMANKCTDTLFDILAENANGKIDQSILKSILNLVIDHLRSSFSTLRSFACRVIEKIAAILDCNVINLVEEYFGTLSHWLKSDRSDISNLTPQCQIGIFEAIAYLCSKNPSKSFFDSEMDFEQKLFDQMTIVLGMERFQTSLAMVVSDKEAEGILLKIKQSALRALLAYKDSQKHSEAMFTQIFNALTGDSKEIQDVAFCVMTEVSKVAPPSFPMLHNAMKPLLLEFSRFNGLTAPLAQKLFVLTKLFPEFFTEKLCDQLYSHLNKWLELSSSAGNIKPTLQFLNPDMETCALIVEIFCYVPSASDRYIDYLVPLLTKAEEVLQIGPASPCRKPLLKFLLRFPTETTKYIFQESSLKEEHIRNFFLWFLKQHDAKLCRDLLYSDCEQLLALLDDENPLNSIVGKVTLQTFTLRIIRTLVKFNIDWLEQMSDLVDRLKTLWIDEQFTSRLFQDGFDVTVRKGPVCVLKCLFAYFTQNESRVELLFDLLRCLQWKACVNLTFFRSHLEKNICEKSSIEWKRNCFFKFVIFYTNPATDARHKALVLQYIIIPFIARSFENGIVDELIGMQANPEIDSDDNIVSVFMTKVVLNNAELMQINKIHDVLLICLYQLASLFVEYASSHIHDGSKRQGARLRTMMMFGWPCLQQNHIMDSIAKYYGHLLIAHIIRKFAINRKIVLQVFLSLLRAHGQETRNVVRQALNILTPAVPLRMEDGHAQLAQIIKKILVEESHSTPQLIHILQLLTRHYKVFYDIRLRLMQQIISSMQKVAVQSNATEHRKLAVDVCEMIVKWEIQRLKGDHEPSELPDIDIPFEKSYIDAITNFLIRLACQTSDSSGNSAGVYSSAEHLPKRCLNLLKIALKNEMWGFMPELKIHWIDKALSSFQDQSANTATICICLDVVTFVISCLPPKQVITLIRPIQRGLSSCLNSTNSQMVKSMYGFITKLLSVLKSDNSNDPTTIEVFDLLYEAIQRVLNDTFTLYEKSPSATITTLGSALMLLKALCYVNSPFIDEMLPLFVRTIQKLAKDYASAVISESVKTGSDMLIVCLDLMKTRMDSMSPDLSRLFINNVLYIILDKSPNPKLILCVIKLIDEWFKNGLNLVNMTESSLQEKSQLIQKLMCCIEKRFSNDKDITKAFLDLSYIILSNRELNETEFHNQLRLAMVMGLCCSDPATRQKYLEMFNKSVPSSLYDRLYHIMCRMRWDVVGNTYWIKYCLSACLILVQQDQQLELAKNWQFTDVSFQNYGPTRAKSDILEFKEEKYHSKSTSSNHLSDTWTQDKTFLVSTLNKTMSEIMPNIIALCEESDATADSVWCQILPEMWRTFTENERATISAEIAPFLSSKYHQKQTDSNRSILKTFVDSFNLCEPTPLIRPMLLRYLAQSHGLWYRSILIMERTIDESNSLLLSNNDNFDDERLEAIDCSIDLYAALDDGDMWTKMWLLKSKFPDTVTALTFSQHEMFDEAAECLEKAMTKEESRLSALSINLNVFNELRLWEDQWIVCMKELNQWDLIQEFAASKESSDPFLLLESAWRIPNWPAMKESIFQVEHACPVDFLWQLQLYRGYWALCGTGSGDDSLTSTNTSVMSSPSTPTSAAMGGTVASVERWVDATNQALVRRWRQMPVHVIGAAHRRLLQAAQRAVELHEAALLSNGLASPQISRQHNIIDVKSVVKTWRYRSPTMSDSLSHWSQIYTWRLYHYQNLINTMEMDPQSSQNSVLGVHAYCQCLGKFAQAARKRGLTSVAVDIINRLHTIPNLPVVDGFHKLREQVACCLKTAKLTDDHQYYREALDLIDSTNISYFSKETSGEYHALKGHVLSKLQKQEATQTFSAGLQMFDASARSWAYWGTHLESQFETDTKSLTLASQAIVCFLQASRLCQLESKANKYMSRILWLLKHDNQETSCLHEALVKFIPLLPPLHWVLWIPDLLSHLKQTCEPKIVDLLIRVGKAFPETLFYSMKFFDLPNMEDDLNATLDSAALNFSLTRPSIVRRKSRVSESISIEPWQKCFNEILNSVRDAYPFMVNSLSKICRELRSLIPTDWTSICLLNLRATLNEAFLFSFEHRNDNQLTTVPAHLAQRLKKCQNILAENQSSDPNAEKLFDAFTKDFDEEQTSTPRLLQPLCVKLVKWINLLERKMDQTLAVKKTFLPELSPTLAAFQTRYIVCDMPGEIFSARQPSHFRMKISKFSPKLEIVKRGVWLCPRVKIRAVNGKEYAFIVVKLTSEAVSTITTPLTQVRFTLLLQLFNNMLQKNKETASRLLKLHFANIIPLNSDTVLMSDDGDCLTLLDLLNEVLVSKENNELANPNDLVLRYFDKVTVHQSRCGRLNEQTLRDIFKDMTSSAILPKCTLQQHMLKMYSDAESYFVSRRQFSNHLAMATTLAYTLSIPIAQLDMITVDKETGSLVPLFSTFTTTNSSQLQPAILTRLTPCVVNYLSFTLNGPFISTMRATARCLQENDSNFLRPLKLWVYNEENCNNKESTMLKDQRLKTTEMRMVEVEERIKDWCKLPSQTEENELDRFVEMAQNFDALASLEPRLHAWF